MAGGRPASGPASSDRQRWLAALAVVALLGNDNAGWDLAFNTLGGVLAAIGCAALGDR